MARCMMPCMQLCGGQAQLSPLKPRLSLQDCLQGITHGGAGMLPRGIWTVSRQMREQPGLPSTAPPGPKQVNDGTPQGDSSTHVEMATCLPQLLDRRSVRRLGWTSVSKRLLRGVRHQLRELRVVHQESLLVLADKGLASCTVASEGLLAGGGRAASVAASVAASEELLAGVRPHRLTDPGLRVGLADQGLAGCTVAWEGWLADGGLAECVATLEELLAGVRPHTLPEELLLLRDEFDIAGELAKAF